MSKKLDLTGQRFGRLVVLEEAASLLSPAGYLHRRFKCLCDCRRISYPTLKSLRIGDSKSCGCLKAESAARVGRGQTHRRGGLGSSGFRALLYRYKYNARKRGKQFLLSEDQFREITQAPCYYCGLLPNRKQYGGSLHDGSTVAGLEHGSYLCNGVDRLDNAGDYTAANSVACCERCNRVKSDTPLSEAFEHLQRMLDVYNSRLNKSPK